VNYEAAFSIAAVILSVQIVANFIKYNRVSNAQSTYFILLVVDNAITALTSIVKWLVVKFIDDVPINILEISSHIYFITHFLVVILMFFYLFSTIRSFREIPMAAKAVIAVPGAGILLFVLSNPVTYAIFYYTPDGVYHRAAGIVAVYIGFIYYMGLILFSLLYYRESFSARRRNIVLVILGLGMISTVVQLFIPQLVVECCMISICSLILFLFIQNPSERLDPDLDVLSSAAFLERMKYSLITRKRFDMVEVIMPELGDYERSAGQTAMTELLKAVVYFLSTLRENITIFRIDKGIFALEISHPKTGEVTEVVKKIEERFGKPWGEEATHQSVRILRMALPTELQDITLMQGVMKSFAESPDEMRLMKTADFDLDKIRRDREITGTLSRAIDSNKFEIRYTPVYSQALERVVAAEVALLFFDEELGYIYDDELFRFAQRSGQVMQLSEMVFDNTCRFIKEQGPDKMGLSFLAIRLHPAMCLQYRILDRLKASMEKYGIDPRMICLMLSEYTVSTARRSFKASIAEIEKTGIRICLEDYGSGFTSITSIFEMPFTVLKINRSVIRSAMDNAKARITMDCTLTMARELDMMTMVEGIDDAGYLNMISNMACDLAKGNYFYEQLVEEEFLKVIQMKVAEGGED